MASKANKGEMALIRDIDAGKGTWNATEKTLTSARERGFVVFVNAYGAERGRWIVTPAGRAELARA